MSKTVAYVTICTLGLILGGCPEEQPFKPTDFSRMNDMSGSADLMTRVYTAATPNQIDTSGAAGSFGKGTAVKLTGVVVVTPSRFIEAMQNTRCDYLLHVQDPACTTPPCGIMAIVKGATKAAADKCPFTDDTTSVLKGSRVGDMVDIEGVVDLRTWSPLAMDGGTMSTIEHQVDIDTYVKTGTGTVTAMTVTDGSKFTTYGNGSEWNKYEGTLIKVQPGGKLQVTKVDGAVQPYHFYTSPGNTDWGTDNRGLYRADGGADFPQVGLQFTSISGVPVMAFGGAIQPRFMNDFVP